MDHVPVAVELTGAVRSEDVQIHDHSLAVRSEWFVEGPMEVGLEVAVAEQNQEGHIPPGGAVAAVAVAIAAVEAV